MATHTISSAPVRHVRRTRLTRLALAVPLAAASIVTACDKSAASTPTAPTTATAGDQATALSGGGSGPKGPGGVRAYAVVSGGPSPTFEPAYTSGFTAVTSIYQGVYCLTPAAGISPESAPAVVSPARFSLEIPFWDQSATNEPPLCPAGQYRVALINPAGQLTYSGSFTIMVP